MTCRVAGRAGQQGERGTSGRNNAPEVAWKNDGRARDGKDESPLWGRGDCSITNAQLIKISKGLSPGRSVSSYDGVPGLSWKWRRSHVAGSYLELVLVGALKKSCFEMQPRNLENPECRAKRLFSSRWCRVIARRGDQVMGEDRPEVSKEVLLLAPFCSRRPDEQIPKKSSDEQ